MVKRYEEAISVIDKCMEMRLGDVNFIMRGQIELTLSGTNPPVNGLIELYSLTPITRLVIR